MKKSFISRSASKSNTKTAKTVETFRGGIQLQERGKIDLGPKQQSTATKSWYEMCQVQLNRKNAIELVAYTSGKKAAFMSLESPGAEKMVAGEHYPVRIVQQGNRLSAYPAGSISSCTPRMVSTEGSMPYWVVDCTAVDPATREEYTLTLSNSQGEFRHYPAYRNENPASTGYLQTLAKRLEDGFPHWGFKPETVVGTDGKEVTLRHALNLANDIITAMTPVWEDIKASDVCPAVQWKANGLHASLVLQCPSGATYTIWNSGAILASANLEKWITSQLKQGAYKHLVGNLQPSNKAAHEAVVTAAEALTDSINAEYSQLGNFIDDLGLDVVDPTQYPNSRALSVREFAQLTDNGKTITTDWIGDDFYVIHTDPVSGAETEIFGLSNGKIIASQPSTGVVEVPVAPAVEEKAEAPVAKATNTKNNKKTTKPTV